MGKRRRKQYSDDDGRTIAPMNIDGMPWHVELHSDQFRSQDGENDEEKSQLDAYLERLREEDPGAAKRLERKDTFWMAFAALKAAMLVVVVFVAVMLLFILFCVYVWF